MVYKKGQKIKCEICGELTEENVEDYAIAGRVGPNSIADDMCEYCDWEFSVENIGDNSFDVKAL